MADSTTALLLPDGGWRPATPRAEIVVRERRGDSIFNAMTGLGSFGDKGQVGRPNPFHIPLTDQELEILYTTGGIARRLINIVSARACRRGWTVPGIGREDARLQTFDRVEQGMDMSRLYGGAIGLLVTEDDVPSEWAGDPAGWLRQPMDLARVGRLDAVQIFDALECWPSRWNEDVRSPTFRLPSEWAISCQGYRGWVHASRVLHFRGAKRQPSRYRNGRTRMPDDSVLQAIWDDLRKLQETLQSGAVLAAEIREAVLTIADYDAVATGDEAAALDARIRIMGQGRSVLGMSVLGPGDKFESRSNPPTGFDQLSAAAWEALAAVTGIPQVILMGSTPGGLNTDGESSWEGFRQLVSTYQESHRHLLEQLYTVVYAAQDGPTRGVAPEGWGVTFAALDEPKEATIAETRKTVMETDIAGIRAGIMTAADVARSRFGPGGWSIDLLPVTPPENGVAASPLSSVGLPALVQAGILGRGEARRLLGAGTSAAPTPAELAALAANPPPSAPAPRSDAIADDAVCVLIPAADHGLRPHVEAVIGQPLVAEVDPHVTVLYVGGGLTPEQVAEVVAIVTDQVMMLSPTALLGCPTARAFPPGPDGTPIVLEYSDAYALTCWQECLLRACAHLITARQHPTYRPHVTLGYAADLLTPEAVAGLLSIVPPPDTPDAPDLRIPISEVRVTRGTEVLAVLAVGAMEPSPGAVAE